MGVELADLAHKNAGVPRLFAFQITNSLGVFWVLWVFLVFPMQYLGTHSKKKVILPKCDFNRAPVFYVATLNENDKTIKKYVLQ